ncbi:hypothetical protein A0W34_11900 [Rhodococcus sp. BH4]|uniref:hypothetical protein n=1 Tax=Rhodococcus sp. BH4 TaxID=1807790 RepID=UPI0009C35C8B|nr:hypothetical protein [Rhodococcus sp. BH4]ARE33942.1 hypothetical protein A0W34_11900 [Rhodococcus sp. BH4]
MAVQCGDNRDSSQLRQPQRRMVYVGVRRICADTDIDVIESLGRAIGVKARIATIALCLQGLAGLLTTIAVVTTIKMKTTMPTSRQSVEGLYVVGTVVTVARN